MLPNTRLLARAFHRAQVVTTTHTRALSASPLNLAWEGSKPEDHATETSDTNNVQIDASKEGKAERSSSEGSGASTEKDHGNEKAKKDHPEAPGPVIGMNDERGSKGH